MQHRRTGPRPPGYLLTGATGFLGQYLLRDALLAEVPVAVLVRATRSMSAARRIDAILAPWEQHLKRTLPRPVVLEGDMTEPTLQLTASQREWVAGHCTEVIHSAASVKFQVDSQTGDPYESNVQGTRRLLEFCRQTGITTFHQVSTAYVCGSRRGRILETELDCGQSLGNDYEQSKFDAEKIVRADTHLQRWTIFRPSIIVGDSQTGATTAFHGVYAALRLGYLAVQQTGTIPGSSHWFFDTLGMTGNERKNLVPVDWVAAVMGHVIRSSAGYGRTYHLTNPRPVLVQALAEAGAAAIAKASPSDPQRAELAVGQKLPLRSPLTTIFGQSLDQHMDVYRAYLRDDPEFDDTNTRRAAPNLPCPELDSERLSRLVDYATLRRFEPARLEPVLPEMDVERYLAPLLETGRETQCTSELQLEVSGSGGGAWRIGFGRDGSPVIASRSFDRSWVPSAYTNVNTFADLVRGRLQTDGAFHRGRLVVQLGAGSGEEATQQLRRLCSYMAGDSLAAGITSATDGALSRRSDSRV